MKKIKRIFALIGAILLFGLYASLIILAFLDPTSGKNYLKLGIALTILIPVLLYAMMLFYRLLRKDDN